MYICGKVRTCVKRESQELIISIKIELMKIEILLLLKKIKPIKVNSDEKSVFIQKVIR